MQIPTEHEANVFGQLDTYAKKIERTFHVTLIERNGEIKIMGEEGRTKRHRRFWKSFWNCPAEGM